MRKCRGFDLAEVEQLKREAAQALELKQRNTDPAAFVISLNLKRRHMTEGQRAAVAAKLVSTHRGERTDLGTSSNSTKFSQEEAAKMLNVGRYSVSVAARAIKDGIPEVVQALENGQIGADRAHKISQLPKEDQPKALAEKLGKTSRPKPEGAKPRSAKPRAIPRHSAPCSGLSRMPLRGPFHVPAFNYRAVVEETACVRT